MKIPSSHPRALSLSLRNLIVEGIEKGITSIHGLIAHGRGEAFDYLLGEKTTHEAQHALRVAAAELLCAEYPIISMNGNVAALCMKEMIHLAQTLNAFIEVNIFHFSKERVKMIESMVRENGGKNVLMNADDENFILLPGIDHPRARMHPRGIAQADCIFVPLEDGDRCEALVKSGRKVITVDLNPLSRTARTATITIVDNIMRTIPLLIEEIKKLKVKSKDELAKIMNEFDNRKNLDEMEGIIRRGA